MARDHIDQLAVRGAEPPGLCAVDVQHAHQPAAQQDRRGHHALRAGESRQRDLVPFLRP
jgi:hypothetical protein